MASPLDGRSMNAQSRHADEDGGSHEGDHARSPSVPPFFGPIVAPGFLTIFARPSTAPVYWGFLARLYVLAFEGERSRIFREDAYRIGEQLYLEGVDIACDGDEEGRPIGDVLWSETAAELLAEGSTTAAAPDSPHAVEDAQARAGAVARYLVQRCVRAGWIALEYQREWNAEVVNFTPTAMRTLDVWLRESRHEQPPLQGFLVNLRALLAPGPLEQQPADALLQAREHLRAFHRELVGMGQNMAASITRVLREALSARDVLDETLVRYRRRVTGNYHRLKTQENLHRFRNEIQRRLDAVDEQSDILDRATKQLADREEAPATEAAARLRHTVAEMHATLAQLPRLLLDLDTLNARYSGAAYRQLNYLLHQDANIEGMLEMAVRKLAEGDPDEEGLTLEGMQSRTLAHPSEEAGPFANDASPVAAADYLYRPPVVSIRAAPAPVAQPTARLSAEMLARLAARQASALTPETLNALAERLLGPLPARPIRTFVLDSPKAFIEALVVIGWSRRGSPRAISRFERVTCDPALAGDPCGDLSCRSCRYHDGPYVLPNGVLVRQAPSASDDRD